jgi:oligosaccharide repeat unit polymerase
MTEKTTIRSASRHRVTLLSLSVICFASAATLSITKLNWEMVPSISPLLAALGAACCVPLLVALLRRTGDVFEPVYIFALTNLVYFVIVPLELIQDRNRLVVFGVDYNSELPKVLFMALLSVIGFYIGYYVAGGYNTNQLKAHTPLGQTVLRSAHNWSIGLLIFFTTAVALWIVVARIPLRTLWVFGNVAYLDWKCTSSGPSIGYLYGSREAIPACLLLTLATRSSRRWGAMALALIIVISVIFAGMGSRSRVLLLVLSLYIFYYLERQRRPSWISMLVVASVLFYVVIGGLGFYRTRVDQNVPVLGQDAYTVAEAWDILVNSSELVRASAVVTRWVPALSGYRWGRDFLQILVAPIPRFMWPGKSMFVSEDLTDFWWTGAAPPMWSVFYVNFGPVGVLLGMILLGLLSRQIYRTHLQNPESSIAQVALALYLPLLLKIYGRGHASLIFYNVVRVYLPLILISFLVRRWQQFETNRQQVSLQGTHTFT